MKNTRHRVLVAFIFVLLLSIAVTYYQYIVRADFSYESKPLEAFTEEDF